MASLENSENGLVEKMERFVFGGQNSCCAKFEIEVGKFYNGLIFKYFFLKLSISKNGGVRWWRTNIGWRHTITLVKFFDFGERSVW